MEYRLDFCVQLFIELVFQAIHLAFYGMVFGLTANIAGWLPWEIVVFMGTVFIVDALMMSFVHDSMIKFAEGVNKGDLDFALLKPVDLQFLTSFRYFRGATVLSGVVAVVMVCVALYKLGWQFDPVAVLLYMAMCISSFLLLFSTNFMFQCIAFWAQSGQGFAGWYFQFYAFFTKPDSVFKGKLRLILTFVFPATVIGSFPARAILDKEIAAWMITWSLVAGIGSMALSRFVLWRGLKRYDSASS